MDALVYTKILSPPAYLPCLPGSPCGPLWPRISPFAADPASLPAMCKIKTPPNPDLPAAPTRDAVRTPLFWLLYEHHEPFAEGWRGHRVKWPAVCAWAAAHGVSDQQGNAIQPGTAKKAWARVCALKAQEKAEREARRRPSLNPTPRQTLPPPPVAAPTRAEVPETPQSDAEKRMALMQARINQRSGRLA